jgi:hypothetical protein
MQCSCSVLRCRYGTSEPEFELFVKGNDGPVRKVETPTELVLSTDHELISARNASLAAMHGSASGSGVRYCPTWKHSPLKEINEQGCYNAQTARCLQLGCESLRLLIADQEEVFRPPACFELPPPCTKGVYTPQRSTCELWKVPSGTARMRVLEPVWSFSTESFRTSRRVPGSDFGPETGYSGWRPSWLFSVPPDKCPKRTLSEATAASFHFLSHSSFIHWALCSLRYWQRC